MSNKVPSLPLNNGQAIPIIGLGTWQAPAGEIGQAVETAIDIGYRHLDCALAYKNEDEIGNAIQKKIKDGTVTREEMFITTKLPPVMHNPTSVREAINTSLKLLKLDYVDLYLIHFAVGIHKAELEKLGPGGFSHTPADPTSYFNTTDHLQIWQEMEKLVDEGLVKSIGLSNFNEKQVQRIIDNSQIKPAVLQVECHAYFPQNELFVFCYSNKIVLEAYAPIGSPERWGGNASGPVLLQEPILKTIGQKYGKSPAQVLLRWLTQRGIVVLPKSTHAERIRQNFEVLDFQLSHEDNHEIDKLREHGGRLFEYAMWKSSPQYPF